MHFSQPEFDRASLPIHRRISLDIVSMTLATYNSQVSILLPKKSIHGTDDAASNALEGRYL